MEGMMKSKRFLGITAIASIVLIGGFLLAPHELFTQSQQTQHNTSIRKIGKKWKIDKVIAKKGDDVSWSASSTDLYFQFMDSTLFGEYNYTLKRPMNLTLKVKGASGTYRYSIFNIADSTFVTGNSPPTIIIP